MVGKIKQTIKINNLVIVSDLHVGCSYGLCPPGGLSIDGGGLYYPNNHQLEMWQKWREFWDVWIPKVCHKEHFILIVNGDSIDGVHHGTITQITHNLTYQRLGAEEIIKEIVNRDDCEALYFIRGTEAHVGKSGQEEEQLARTLGAIPNQDGQYARWELWFQLHNALVHVAHHIGGTGASAYESTAIMRELVNAYTEAGRWKQQVPDIIARSHRHRNAEVRVPSAIGYGIAFTTPGWQLKTPLVYRTNMKLQSPQIGGSVIRAGDEDIYTRHKVWDIKLSEVEKYGAISGSKNN